MKKYVLSVLAAGTFWGTTGVFRRLLDSSGLSTNGVVFVRSFFAFVCFTVLLLIHNRDALKIKLKDLWCFLGTGLVSFLLFTLCYFKAMTLMSLSTAAILLYSAPCFVILLSIPCFGEKLSVTKVVALVMAFVGCCFVSGIGSGENHLTVAGILFGIGSGICYALYSIFSRFALNKGYSSLTINFWTCLLSMLGSLAIGGYEAVPVVFGSGKICFLALATGIVTCFLPYLLYTYGLTGLENGKTSIIASIEPVVATICGVVIFKESLSVQSVIGIVFVLSAIVVLNVKFGKVNSKEKTSTLKIY